ncbi:hypothetical protein [Flavobacterium psychrophilum]|uniref:Secreted protein n=1 Tax=Flavobacterium psychrophilum TaxID=96345 RepID=A0A7U2R892_FLAPS|nr:hypothetical protein [Flavobacterium psychrophilum]EKT4509267.1 hypothetical protein [Flavobacterium psychrophilum]MCB6089383.1 hypothetical protein [Flavobacterium psychrophilum]OAE92209.1 hypothetical protein SU65_10670 [Flavobacterium psychrophilum]OJH11897.1 hypothetical protein FPG87_05220 [Flavobacterium psychrophilum]QRE02690.1 hypothetical protein H0H26_07100 [Flavobacterium psychrophilum]
MKLFYIIIFVFVFSANNFAQEASSIPSTGIPRVDIAIPKNQNATPQFSISKPFEITKFKKSSKIYDATQLQKPNPFNLPISDLNPGKINAAKMNKAMQEEHPEFYARDQIFGVIRTKSQYAKVIYFDYAEPDGDNIRIWENEIVIIQNAYLTNSRKEVILDLFQSSNKIEFEALNEGLSPPNTAQFDIYDDKGNLLFSNQWALSKGYRASIIIEKER